MITPNLKNGKPFLMIILFGANLTTRRRCPHKDFMLNSKITPWVIDAQNNRYGAEVMKAVKGQILV